IVGWLLVQVAVPAAWYLRGGGPDERFTWRMFSTERLTRCQVAVIERGTSGTRALDLASVVHKGWITLLSRGQPAVTAHLVAARCAVPGTAALTIERRCVGPD